MTASIEGERKFWQIALPDLEKAFGAGRNGLSSAEVAARRLRYGPNILEERRRLSLPRKFLSRFRNPLVLILLVAAVISALTGDLASFIIIATIVLMSAVLDTVQEYRAEEAAEHLKVSVALKEQVLRDGQEVTVLGRDLVPGDIVLLAAGDLVPADGRIIEARDFFVDEALLTGESYPAEKQARDAGVDSPEVAEASNAAFMGSSVMSGSARLMVCRTGLATELGQISSSLRRAPPPSALDQGAHRFGMLIVRFTEVLVLFVLLINLLFHRPWLESFLFAVALAVGLTPELLPMIISVTLARGAIRMAKAQVIVKRLGAIHDLGSMDVLCTDKTGTLTEAKISLARQVALSGADSPRVLDLAWLNSHFQAGLRNPLDAAIVESGVASGPAREAGWVKTDEVPFDFQRRRVSVLVEHEGHRLLITKGAPVRRAGQARASAARRRGAGPRRESLRGAQCGGISRTRRRLARTRTRPGAGCGGRRAGIGFCRVRRLLRSTQKKRGGGHRRARGQGCRHQDPQRRQRAGNPACLRRTRHSGHRVADRYRNRSAQRRSARRAAGTDEPVLPGHARSKEPHHSRVEAPRSRRRVSRRRDQRRAVAAQRGCRHFGR